MGTHLRELSESFPMNTNKMVFKNLCIIVLWMKVASALEGLMYIGVQLMQDAVST